MKNKKVPKYIEEKSERIKKLCEDACVLKREIEQWAESNGIDIYSHEWEENVRDETGVRDAVFCVDEIEELLNR